MAAAAALADTGEMTDVVEMALVTRGALATLPDFGSLFGSTEAGLLPLYHSRLLTWTP